MSPKKIWKVLKAAASAWVDDYAASMGAALSFYTMFSIAPLVLIVIAVAGFVFGEEAARGAIMGELQELMGEEGARGVENMVASAGEPRQGMIASVVGVATLLVGATTVFAELQSGLDRIWRAPAREQSSGVWSLIRARLLSFGMILGIAFLLMVSLVLSAAVAALGQVWAPFFGAWEIVAQTLNVVLGFAVTTVLFAMIYKIMPRANVSWSDVWIGAAVTALLFTIGRFLIGLYLGKSGITSTYGAAGSLVLMMLWVYYSAQIFLLGAEFTWVYAHEYGSRRGQPRPSAAAPERREDTTHARGGAPAPVQRSAEPGASHARVSAPSGRTAPRRPLTAMAIAASAGAALALLTRVRARRRAGEA